MTKGEKLDEQPSLPPGPDPGEKTISIVPKDKPNF